MMYRMRGVAIRHTSPGTSPALSWCACSQLFSISPLPQPCESEAALCSVCATHQLLGMPSTSYGKQISAPEASLFLQTERG